MERKEGRLRLLEGLLRLLVRVLITPLVCGNTDCKRNKYNAPARERERLRLKLRAASKSPRSPPATRPIDHNDHSTTQSPSITHSTDATQSFTACAPGSVMSTILLNHVIRCSFENTM